MYLELAFVALFTFGFTMISGRVERMPISGPIIFVLAGLLVGPIGLGVFESDIGRGNYRTLVDLTLTLILFADAANARSSVLRGHWGLPARMLGIGLPLAILLGTGLAWWMFDEFSLYEAAVLGTMLAATDAALGKAVITNELVPARLREGLNVESGLNDGLCVPILLVFLALSGGNSADEAASPLMLVAEEIGIGFFVGVLIGGTGALLLKHFAAQGSVSRVWLQLAVPSLALACFAVAQSAHGSGYIAAFCGGMLFGRITRDQVHALCMPSEGIGEALAMITWMIFGMAVVGQNFGNLSPQILLYSLLSLTVVRMLPIYLSMAGTGESRPNKLFLGWFGPRGLASIVFAIIVLDESIPAGSEIVNIVIHTIGFSLLLHGITANPLSSWIGARQGVAGDGQSDRG